jgi:DNA recombination protein RmuC
VAERLEQVHKGLGEMQTLAQGVGDLKRLLTNVKTRGLLARRSWPRCWSRCSRPSSTRRRWDVPGSRERVEFAIRLPAPRRRRAAVAADRRQVPAEDYERLLDAQERADALAAELRPARWSAHPPEARSITPRSTSSRRTPPTSPSLFLPTEGLYAEVLRRPGLVERCSASTA